MTGNVFLAVLGLALAAGSGLRAQEESGKGLDVLFKASAMRGLPVANEKNQDLGKIDDIVLNTDGSINYLAVSYGGALGVGDKLFAIPYKAFTVEDNYKGKGAGHFYARLPVDRIHFDNGPGFNKDAWPNKPDMGFLKAAGKEAEGAKETIKEGAREAKEAVAADSKSEKDRIFRTSKVIGSTVQNNAGQDLGKVNDMMIQTRKGQVAYVALAHGGVGGAGAKLFSVAFDALTPKALTGKPNEQVMVLNVDKAWFDNNAGFDKDHWPAEPDKNLTRDATKKGGTERK